MEISNGRRRDTCRFDMNYDETLFARSLVISTLGRRARRNFERSFSGMERGSDAQLGVDVPAVALRGIKSGLDLRAERLRARLQDESASPRAIGVVMAGIELPIVVDMVETIADRMLQTGLIETPPSPHTGDSL